LTSESARWKGRPKTSTDVAPALRRHTGGRSTPPTTTGRSLRIASFLLSVALLTIEGAACRAQLPTPERVGFRHCALIYERPTRSAADLLPYVSRVVRGEPRAWLFDAFLFLHFNAASGARTDEGPTLMGDWESQLDQWFAPGRDLHALDEAVAQAARKLPAPPAPRKIILSMPYPNPKASVFGALPGGVSPDLGTAEGLRAAAQWYTAEARRRFDAAGFRHLRLWGLYWMREEMSRSDEPRAAIVADVAHRARLRLAWIPWWRATGFDRWRRGGFDVAFLQPNYAFHSWTHGGAVRRNRLAVAADLARKHGLGMEMEAGAVTESEADRKAFLHYLADGAPTRLGYQRSAMAYFLSTDTVERTASSRDPAHAAVYTALADFVEGKPVRDPDPALTMRSGNGGVVGRLRTPCRVTSVDIQPGPGATDWHGIVEVLVRAGADGTWRPGGWAIRAGQDEGAGRHQVLTVPVGVRASELCVRTRGKPAPWLRSARIVPETLSSEAPRTHSACGCSYSLSGQPRGTYDDNGAKLTDGVVPSGGFGEGRSVGWTTPTAAVCFDLGSVTKLDRVEVFCQGGSAAAVNWPAETSVLLADSRPAQPAMAGAGAVPSGLRWYAGGRPAITRRRSETDQDGVIAIALRPGARARYVTVAFRSAGWLMLSEIRILDGVRNLARAQGVRYTLRPHPTPSPEAAAHYADDGVRLTDGVVARSLNRAQVTGWSEGDERTLDLDLGSVLDVSSVTVWTLAGGLHGVYAPESIAVEGSRDGRDRRALGRASSVAVVEDGRTCSSRAFRLRLKTPVGVRHLHFTIRRARGWAMLSEIEVATGSR